MRIPSVLCLMTMPANSANAQSSTLEPIHVSPGTILKFHLQTRLNPGAGNEVDRKPIKRMLQGTLVDPFGHIWLIGKIVE